MKYDLLFTKSAKKDVAYLSVVSKKQIQKKLEYFIGLDNPLAIAKKLNNFEIGEYRWRVGDYRIIFDLEKLKTTTNIVVIRIAHRREVYKK